MTITSTAVLTTLAFITVLIWMYLLLGRAWFWNARRMLLPHAAATGPCRVAVVIPARNEADVIAQSLGSLLRQTGAENLHVFVVDDHSTDTTAEVARQTAQNLGRSDQLTVIESQPLPGGWVGKVWAMHQGIQHALELEPEFLLLTDADIVHAPDSIAALLAKAGEGFALTSVMVLLECGSLAEKLLIPAFVFFFLKLYPPAWIADPRSKVAGAAGGCMLVRPGALLHAGGMAAIRNDIIDDCSLARCIKQSGGRVHLSLSQSTRSIRPYVTFGEIGRMIARSAFRQLNHSALMLAGALVALTMTYLAPPVLLPVGLICGAPLVAMLALAAWAMMGLTYLPMVRLYGINVGWALALPAAAAFYMGATLISAINFWTGRGGRWKGRSQDAAHPLATQDSGK